MSAPRRPATDPRSPASALACWRVMTEFLDCPDLDCEELRIDLLECLRTELLLAALRERSAA